MRYPPLLTDLYELTMLAGVELMPGASAGAIEEMATAGARLATVKGLEGLLQPEVPGR